MLVEPHVGVPYCILSSDVKRAFFFANAKRPIFIKIPSEDFEPGDQDKVGRLNLSLYRTRDAAMNWQDEFTTTLIEKGFRRSQASSCNFYKLEKTIYMTVHGDDFTSIGPEEQLQWLKHILDEAYECKQKWSGPGDNREQRMRVLNRVIEWMHIGTSYEADQRHVDVVLNRLQLQEASDHARGSR